MFLVITAHPTCCQLFVYIYHDLSKLASFPILPDSVTGILNPTHHTGLPCPGLIHVEVPILLQFDMTCFVDDHRRPKKWSRNGYTVETEEGGGAVVWELSGEEKLKLWT